MPNTAIPADPLKPDMKARRSSQQAMYSLYKVYSKKLTSYTKMNSQYALCN